LRRFAGLARDIEGDRSGTLNPERIDGT